MTQFERLRISGWRQFQNVDLAFHPRLTIMTGANGSGKSTILNMLSVHFGWQRHFLTTPKRVDGATAFSYQIELFDKLNDADEPNSSPESEGYVGTLKYTDGSTTEITVPIGNLGFQYVVNFRARRQVGGVYVTPQRPIQQYQRVTEIPTEPILAQVAFQQWFGILMQRYNGQFNPQTPLYKMKQSIISMAMFGPGNINSPPIPEISKTFDGFVEVLRKLLPVSLGFQSISVRTPDIVLITETGEWMLDEASGGITALVEMAWQIYLFSHGASEFVVLVDEPETHLHPAMQRQLMPSLIDAFPSAQFIVATHSPFIVSSVKDSTVYVLSYSELPDDVAPNDGTVSPDALSSAGPLKPQPEAPPGGLKASWAPVKRRIVSQALDLVTKAGTANEVLRDVLGVPIAVPGWVADEVSRIVAEYSNQEFTAETLNQLRGKLDDLGMIERFPEAIAELGKWS